MNEIEITAAKVREGARWLARASTRAKNDALTHMAAALRERSREILAANAVDVKNSERDTAFVDRLKLTPDRVEAMAAAIEEVRLLEDPIGRVDRMVRRPNGLQVGRQRIPLGVVGIIYEARPNVTSDAAALCLKSGNGVLLRGGSDAFASNQAIYDALRLGLTKSSLDPRAHDAVGFINSPDRDAVGEMLKLDTYIDVIIPRGGKSLIRYVNEHSRIPVIKHDEGVCHVVVEGTANADMVDDIVINSKTHRPTVCNSAETLLVLKNAVDGHLARVMSKLAEAGVHMYLDETAHGVAVASNLPTACYARATEEHYFQEFLSLEIAIGVVDDLEAAIAHIGKYGSRHTEALVTNDHALAQAFIDAVDSSCVVINASTRFADGNQLGLGAEIGISTTRLHAYGPMGIEELTTTKFIVLGDGQVRN
ncbi:MAG: glutamate-5-semialdehyde dehydrogenase [bacterium]